MTKPTLVYFGSGPVSAKSLALLAEDFVIEAVVTKPRPAHHKGDFPVLDVAEKLGLKVYLVSNKADLSQLITTKPFKSELGVLIDFGIIVSQDVIDYFPKGIINSHFSLLPELRGADPITFSILSGQEKTGVSLMLLVEKMDEGPLLACDIQEIGLVDTTPSLTDKLIHLSDTLLKRELPRYLDDEAGVVSQEEMGILIEGYPKKASYSRKLTKADGAIDWTKSAKQLEREIRAYIEWPKTYGTIGKHEVIITKAHVKDTTEPKATGTVFRSENDELAAQTGDGLLIIDKLKPAGKKEMSASEYLRGYGLDKA